MHRRALFSLFASSLLLAGREHAEAADILARPQKGIRAYYKVEMQVAVDGRDYVLTCGGEHHIYVGAGQAPGGHYWLPFAAVAVLPDKSILVAIPPSPQGAIEEAYRAGGAGLPSADAPLSFLPYLDVVYPVYATPLVYIFDRGDDPRRIEGYLMRAALAGGTRVLAKGLAIQQVQRDPRISVSGIVPALQPFEELAKALPESRLFLYNSKVPAIKKWQERWRAKLPVRINQPQESLWPASYCAVLRPLSGQPAFGGQAPAFSALNASLKNREYVTVWLNVKRTDGQGSFSFDCIKEPRVAVYELESAGTLAAPAGLRKGVDQLTIGGVPFLGTSGYQRAADESAEVIFCARVMAGNPLTGHHQGGAGGYRRRAFHNALTPSMAGRP